MSPELIVALLSAEHGEFLALDLGGTNFRVLWVRVTDNGLQKVEMEKPADFEMATGALGPTGADDAPSLWSWREETLTPLFAR